MFEHERLNNISSFVTPMYLTLRSEVLLSSLTDLSLTKIVKYFAFFGKIVSISLHNYAVPENLVSMLLM